MDDDDSVDTVNGWEAERLENYCSRKDFSVKGLNTHLQNISQRQKFPKYGFTYGRNL